MLKNDIVDGTLKDFGRDVIKQARNQLTRKGKNSSSELYKSLNYNLKVSENSFFMEFKAADYAQFVDQGVHGSEKFVAGAKFKMGSGSFKGAKGEGGAFDKSIRKWIKQKGLRYRDDSGKFKKGGIKTLSYLIRKSIYTKGIRPSLFFTRGFALAYKRLPDALLEAYALNVSEFIQYTFKTPQDNQYRTNNK